MARIWLIWPLALVLTATWAWADARMTVLVDVLRLNEAAQILSDEGLTQAEDLNSEMFDGQGGAGWQMQVERIYDPSRMVEMVRAELEAELQGALLEDTIGFFGSALGQRIIRLENTAREAIQDPDVEDAARTRYRELVAEGTSARLDQIERYISAGDMISHNVAGAVNSNYQFLRGLSDGNGLEMSEADMLADAARGLDEITEDTTEWLSAFLLLAYSPLEEEELETYIAFSLTEAGKALNRALFRGFGNAYEDISYALGRTVALNMTAQEL